MGDLTFLVPPSATGTPPVAAAVTAPDPEPGPAASSASSSRRVAAPRCRRVHFVSDLPTSSSTSAPVWSSFPPPSAASAAEASSAATEPEKKAARATAAAVAELEEDRMDLLWEDFNEELLAMRRAATGSPSSSDGEASSESSGWRGAPAATAGCFPVLRSSARAGGVAHYRRRAGTWVLLMRIFRRLFVIDKTIAALPRPAPAGSAR